MGWYLQTGHIVLEVSVRESLFCASQILIWWFNTKISASHNSANGHNMRSQQNSSSSSQHAASSMCDEIVTLWRLAALNPALSSIQRDDLATQLKDWHIKTIDKVRKGRSANMSAANSNIKKADIEIFSGFKASIEACQLDWKDYPIPGLTYQENEYHIRWKFSFGKINDGENRKGGRGGKSHSIAQASTTGVQTHKLGGCLMGALLPSQRHMQRQQQQQQQQLQQLQQKQQQHSRQQSHTSDLDPSSAHTDGACSSSSEGFCENDRLDDKNPHDSDSDFNEQGVDPVQQHHGSGSNHHKHKQLVQSKLGNHPSQHVSLSHGFSSAATAAAVNNNSTGASSSSSHNQNSNKRKGASSFAPLVTASSLLVSSSSEAEVVPHTASGGAAVLPQQPPAPSGGVNGKLSSAHRLSSEDLDSDSSAPGVGVSGAAAAPNAAAAQDASSSLLGAVGNKQVNAFTPFYIGRSYKCSRTKHFKKRERYSALLLCKYDPGLRFEGE